MMIKKMLTLLVLLLSLALILVACGGEPQVEDPAPTEAPVEEPVDEPAEEPTDEVMEEPTEEPMEEPTDEPAEEPTEEAAEEPTEEAAEATGDPLRIGVMSDLSGGLVLFGQEMVNGLELGFQYATDGTMAAGGRPIELIILDDTSDVETGAAAARELIEAEGVEILVGNTSSAVALQVQQIADENGVVYFAAPAAAPDITGANWNEHTFRVCRNACLLYTSPSPRDRTRSRMPSSA